MPSLARQNVNAADCGVSKRARAVIDTGCTHTLLSHDFAVTNGIVEIPGELNDVIVALDGSPLRVRGSVDVRLQRTAGPVFLAPIAVSAFVVEDPDVIQTDLLVGGDIVSGSGWLHLEYTDDGKLAGVVFGTRPECTTTCSDDIAAVAQRTRQEHPSRHVEVIREGDDVVLATDDGEVRWDNDQRKWILLWIWKSGEPPACPVGPGLGQYSRSRLTPDHEKLFCDEVEQRISNRWLVEHDEEKHGAIAVCCRYWQAHKNIN